MHSRDFAFWLQGFFELRESGVHGLTERQVGVIKQHLSLVFQHDPSITGVQHPPLDVSGWPGKLERDGTTGGQTFCSNDPPDPKKLFIC